MLSAEQRKKFLILSILAGLILIVAILLLLWWLRPKTPVVPETPDVRESMPAQTIRQEAPAVPPISPSTASAKTVASTFVERYGTYSSDVPFTNVDEVAALVTPELLAVLRATVYDVPEGSEYNGRDTRVLSVTQREGSEKSGLMIFAVTAQHESFTGDRQQSTVTYQQARLTVLKQGETWLVSEFSWQ